jgi:NADPH-dependent curcumin reductase CurA
VLTKYFQHFEEVFERSLTVRGFTLGTGPSAAALPKFYEVATPLFLEGKLTSREHRFTLKETGEALLSVHTGKNVGKAVVIVSEDA